MLLWFALGEFFSALFDAPEVTCDLENIDVKCYEKYTFPEEFYLYPTTNCDVP